MLGGSSTPLITWMIPLVARMFVWMTLAWLTKTEPPETRIVSEAPSTVATLYCATTLLAGTVPATTW